MSAPASRPAATLTEQSTVARAAAVAACAAVGAAISPVSPRRGRPKGSATGTPRRVAKKREAAATPQAKTTAAVVLEGLSGLRSAPEAARALGVTVARYYTLEAQAVAGLLSACEPAPPGPAPGQTGEREMARLRQEKRRQDQELTRLRAVLRTTQRSLGIQPVATSPSASGTGAPGKGGKSRRARRPVVRAMTVVRRLLATGADAPGSASQTTAEGATAAVSTKPVTVSTPSSGPGGG
jgi:hypothetical protein